MIKIRFKLSDFLPLRISPFLWFIGFLQFFYLFQVASYPNLGGISFSLGYLSTCFLSIGSLMLLFQWINLTFGFSRFSIVAANLIGLTIFDLAVAYHFRVGELFNWSILADNADIAVSIEALVVMWNSLDRGALFYLVIFGAAFLYFEYKYRAISKGIQRKPILLKWSFVTAAYLALSFSKTDSFDPILMFLKSIRLHYTAIQLDQILPPDTYPFWKPAAPLLSNSFKKRPKYIFLVVVESLNAGVIDQKTPEGKAITPFLNQFKHDSLYFKNFYGNSVQTAKGHYAIYFSGIPSLTGKVFVKFPQVRLKSVATYLQQAGYKTHYFIAQEGVDFDNEYQFLTQRGFQDFRSVVPALSPDEKKHAFLWGVEDSVFYHHFFKDFDLRITQKKDNASHFFVIVPVANHSPFNSLLPNQRKLYPNPGELAVTELYANSVHLSDAALKSFMQALKDRNLLDDSLVIITGDHGFPLGQHHTYNPEAGYHEESFHPPLFIYWKGHIQPRIALEARSQLDIAPTLLDIAGVTPEYTHFLGKSLFKDTLTRPIYLVQPYGKHFSVVLHPLKYRYHAKLQVEYVYDLEKDPMETKNIISHISASQLQAFRTELHRMFLHQAALMQDQIMPPRI
jgi:phosphoglycerol transferase MdoB-like AlkP superfamily enzyme